MATRTCDGLVAKTGERCAREARAMSRYCGHCDPAVREAKSTRAAAQWGGARLQRAVEEASALIVTHRMGWCRARIMHALAGADEQGALEQVLDELLIFSSSSSRPPEGHVAHGRRWPAGAPCAEVLSSIRRGCTLAPSCKAYDKPEAKPASGGAGATGYRGIWHLVTAMQAWTAWLASRPRAPASGSRRVRRDGRLRRPDPQPRRSLALVGPRACRACKAVA